MLRHVKLFTIVLILLMGAPLYAISLWTPTSASLVTDAKARKAGDLVTVVISEGTSSSQKASTDFDKSIDHSNGAGVGPLLTLLPELKASSEQKGSSSGETTLSNKLVTKVTATVSKVLPNGNMEIKAQRTLQTNGETQEITLTGVIRPQDVGTDNTILSTFISDMAVKCTGKGPIGDRQKEGLISKIVKFLF